MPPSRPPCSFSPSRRQSFQQSHEFNTVMRRRMDGALFKSCTLSELDNGRVQSFLLSLISFILSVCWLRKYRNVYACLTGKPQCSYLLVYYYPCVSQFLTTQKEGENGMSLIFSMFEPNVFAMWSALLETTVIMAFDASLMNI